MQSASKHRHFPNLDGLRFLGAFILIVLHVEGIKTTELVPNIGFINHFYREGNQFVSLFFVLSGFLITYLLLSERKDTGKIDFKRFYSRRILRIWPLYFFIGIIGYFVLPKLNPYFELNYGVHSHIHFWYSLICYVLFLPMAVSSEAMGSAWSVRVEEAFYLVWPWILSYSKKVFRVFVIVIAFVVLTRVVFIVAVNKSHSHLFSLILKQLKDYRFSCMAIGGMAAYFYISGFNKILSFLQRKDIQWVVCGTVFFMMLLRVNIPYIGPEIYSLLFGCIVLNLATNPQSIIKLDYAWMNYLGRISYGLYMYNTIMRIFCLILTQHLFGNDFTSLPANLFMYSTTIASTIAVSAISYEFFEKRFLKLKKHASGDASVRSEIDILKS